MIFDSHAHYDDHAFDEDREEVLSSLAEGGVGTIVNVGASLEGTRRTVELSRKYSFIYGAAGVHPDEAFQQAGRSSAGKRACGGGGTPAE